MRAKEVLSHIFLANILVLCTLVGVFAIQEGNSGYVAIFFASFSPFVLGVQFMHIIHSFKE